MGRLLLARTTGSRHGAPPFPGSIDVRDLDSDRLHLIKEFF